MLWLHLATASIALGPASRSFVGGAASAWTAAVSAAHHLRESPSALRSSTLEDLANVKISGSESEILAHVALPSEPPVTGPLPILILLHEFFGLSESIVAKAQLFADDLECIVIAPDTFRGVSTSFIPKAIWLALSTPQDRVNRDLDDVLAWAASPECGRVAGVMADPKRVAVTQTQRGRVQPSHRQTAAQGGNSYPNRCAGRKFIPEVPCRLSSTRSLGSRVCRQVLGFCYGGGKAIRYTTQSRRDAATVVWYGNPIVNSDELKPLRAPVCAVFGAEDLQIPQPMVNKFRAALEEADIEHEVMSYYGAGHAFWSDVAQVGGRALEWRMRSGASRLVAARCSLLATRCFALPASRAWLTPARTRVAQVEQEEMPVIAGYRLTTNFLRGYFQGKESFARKRAFLEYQLAQGQQAGDDIVEEEEEEEEEEQ